MLKSVAVFDMEYFPFDHQKVTLEIGSWAYDASKIKLYATNYGAGQAPNRFTGSTKYVTGSHGVDMAMFEEHPEWDVLSSEARIISYKYACCAVPYDSVQITIHLKRISMLYSYALIMPSIILSLIAIIGFWVPWRSGERLGLMMTGILTLTVFLILICQKMPDSGRSVPFLTKLMLMMWLISYVVVGFGIGSLNVRYQMEKTGCVPPWLQSYADCIGVLLSPVQTAPIEPRSHEIELRELRLELRNSQKGALSEPPPQEPEPFHEEVPAFEMDNAAQRVGCSPVSAMPWFGTGSANGLDTLGSPPSSPSSPSTYREEEAEITEKFLSAGALLDYTFVNVSVLLMAFGHAYAWGMWYPHGDIGSANTDRNIS